MDIDKWLKKFKGCWINHDVDGVLSLFHRDVVYFETPFHELESFSQLKKAWEGVLIQNNIQLELTIFNREIDRFSVVWHLKYVQDDVPKRFSGTYLIELNSDNLCTYFFHTCEKDQDN